MAKRNVSARYSVRDRNESTPLAIAILVMWLAAFVLSFTNAST